jgi:DNA polymerase III epsilon subunit-like protein
MLLLFLDTETSGVNCQTDQIIEVGGLVIDLNPKNLELKIIDKFESLISLRKPLEDKITRITGITSGDLEFAPKLFTVQENWLCWLEKVLEKENIQGIVGHTIQFDINFLQNENWFLPEKYNLIDTLDLSKIFFPHLQAVNLEFLIEKLNLKDSLQGYHRSLFDCYSAVKIFKQILVNLQNLPLEQEFFDNLQKNFLPLNLTFFENSQEIKNFLQTSKTPNTDSSNKPIEILLNAKIKKPNIGQRLNLLNGKNKLQQIIQLFKINLPKNLALIPFQLYLITIIKTKNPTWLVKFHSQGQNRDFWFVEIILDYLDKIDKNFEIAQIKSNQKTQSYVLGEPEKLIWQIKNLAEESLEIGKLIEYLDFYNQICSLNELYEPEFLTILLKCISAYEFLIMSLQPFLKINRYNYSPQNTPNNEKIILKKFIELCFCLNSLRQNFEYLDLKPKSLNKNYEFVSFLQKKILEVLQNSSFDPSQKQVFIFHKNALFINKTKYNFDLKDHFGKIFETYPNLEIHSFLDVQDFDVFLRMLNLKQVFLEFSDFYEKNKPAILQNSHYTKPFNLLDVQAQNSTTISDKILPQNKTIKVQTLPKIDFLTFSNTGLLEFYNQKFELAISQKKSVLILGGLNSSLKDSQKVLTQNFSPDQYLALGETGSMTKVSSKLVRDFVGIIVVKVNNFEVLANLKDCPEFAEIWILNQPYFFVHSFWEKLSVNSPKPTEFIKNLKKLFLQYQVQKIFNFTKVKANFLKGYK